MWHPENFRAFLEFRRSELARIVNNFIDGVGQDGRRDSVEIATVIASGEGPSVEFKETARINTHTGLQDKGLEAAVVKTAAGFLNAAGGTLVIGVNDSGVPTGLERDLQTLGKGTVDGFELFLRNLLNSAVGADLCARVRIQFPVVDDMQVCAVIVPASSQAVWVAVGNDKVLFIRSGNATQPLDGEAAHRYVTAHWGS